MEMNNKIRVLQYLYGSVDLGGAETMIINIQKQLCSAGYIFDYIVFEDREYYYSSTIKEYGGSVIAIDDGKGPMMFRIIKRWRNLYKTMKNNRYDVFHCNSDTSYRFIELWIAKKASIPIRIIHSHSSDVESKTFIWKIKRILHKLCRSKLVSNATDYFACSDASRLWLFGSEVPKEKVRLISNGIDTKRFRFNSKLYLRYRTEKNISKDEVVICNIGRFYEVKNQKFIIDILKAAVKEGGKVCAYLLGEGHLRKEVECYAQSQGVSQYVIFTGNVSDTEKYLVMSDVYVMPSLFEGLPVSGIEAQCTGIPIIASDNVSRELNITGNCQYVSLQEKPEFWWEIIKNSVIAPEYRESTYRIIEDKGFGIESTTNIIKSVYSGGYEKNDFSSFTCV